VKSADLLLKLPVPLQNVAISLYGLRVKRARYGKVFRDYSAQLQAHERWTVAQIEAYQGACLRDVLTSARASSPYYRDSLAAHKDLTAVSVRDLPEIADILEKPLLRAHAESFYADLPAGQTKTIFTSGTTGSPLVVRVSKAALQRNYAFYARALGWFGLVPTSRHATFAGRVFLPEEPRDSVYWRSNFGMQQKLFSSYHLSDTTLPLYLSELQKWQPEYIDSYPSAIYQLALHIGPHCIRPKAVLVSSETLLDYQRAEIEKAFGCPVIDQYGSAEMVAWANQCERGSMHLSPEYGVVELVDARGKAVPNGEIGEMVCTGFVNDAMPLIRYRIGDTAVLSKQTCPCGRHFPVIEQIVGRTDALIVTPSGKYIGRMDPVFKGVEHIAGSQIIQSRRDALLVKVIPAVGYAQSDRDKLARQIQDRVGLDMHVEIVTVDDIPRTKAGKFQSVISLLQPGSGA